MDLRERLRVARLYLVTPGKPAAGSLDTFLPRVLEAGVDVVQLRDKGLEARLLLALAAVVRRRTEEFNALFVVNDRVDIAVAAGADGVHVGQRDLPVEEARRQIGKERLVGLSTHSREEVLAAAGTTVDYIAVGPVFATPTKPGRPAVGPELVSFAAKRTSLPFFAIGGIDRDSLAAVIEAGARRVAVVRALTDASDPAIVARAIAETLLAAGERPGANQPQAGS